MQYALMFYAEPGYAETLPDAEQEAVRAEFSALVDDVRCVASAQLQPAETATCIRVAGGRTLITDGPFADTKEVLGGVCLADARAAIEKVIQALGRSQPAGVRYASCLLSDGVTFVALLELEDDGSHPLREFPAYQEMVENLKQWYAEPPAVERMTVTGSYGLF